MSEARSALFDQALVRRRLARAAAAPATFLLDQACADLVERLGPVLRRFEAVVDFGTPGGRGAQALLAAGRADHAVALTSIAGGTRNSRLAVAVTDLETLPLAEASADLVVSVLALHTVDDLPGVLAQIRRALRPDGLFIACLAGAGTLRELRDAFLEAEAATGRASPRVAPFADVRALGGLLQRAGFALPVADVDSLTVRYADPIALMRDLRAMGATNALQARSRTPLRRDLLMAACAAYPMDADGRIRASFELVWLTGWGPHDSQQKPLRPGSARMRLADALGARTPLSGEDGG